MFGRARGCAPHRCAPCNNLDFRSEHDQRGCPKLKDDQSEPVALVAARGRAAVTALARRACTLRLTHSTLRAGRTPFGRSTTPIQSHRPARPAVRRHNAHRGNSPASHGRSACTSGLHRTAAVRPEPSAPLMLQVHAGHTDRRARVLHRVARTADVHAGRRRPSGDADLALQQRQHVRQGLVGQRARLQRRWPLGWGCSIRKQCRHNIPVNLLRRSSCEAGEHQLVSVQ